MSLQQRTNADEFDVLNLGCGEDYRSDAWNVDCSDAVDADELVDLEEQPWPWRDDSFALIVAHHVLEHLDPVPMGEICRVLKPGGTLELRYPIGHTRFEDPTHKQFWNWNTAEALAGERKHGHEHFGDLELTARGLDWHVGDRLWKMYTRARLQYAGPGPWLGQIPGLYGEVNATYKYHL